MTQAVNRERKIGDSVPARVLLLDEHWITRAALHGALTEAADLEIAGEATDSDEAVTLLRTAEVPADVLVFTGATDPARLCRQLAAALPEWPLRLLMIGGNGFPDSLGRRYAAAGWGWLPQSAAEKHFIAAARLIAAGLCVAPSPARAGGGRSDSAIDTLTSRELDVLRLLAVGRTNAEISAELQLGGSTVKSHVQNVLAKLGARNRVSAATYAFEIGLVHSERQPQSSNVSHLELM
ncbi:MAG TPA: response regulator transcription factor [Actinophytocola sp.]|jgi:DNA-binding NarL/FixJ family response regulator|nr:response regulator transcription factor [Actinophytocola sp.]